MCLKLCTKQPQMVDFESIQAHPAGIGLRNTVV